MSDGKPLVPFAGKPAKKQGHPGHTIGPLPAGKTYHRPTGDGIGFGIPPYIDGATEELELDDFSDLLREWGAK